MCTPKTVIHADCLQCWNDVCVNENFVVDGTFAHNCCGCVDEDSVPECIPTVINARDSQNCCSIAETNLQSVLFSNMELSDECNDAESYLFHNPLEFRKPVNPLEETLQKGVYIVPSFVFGCTGCVEEVLVQGVFDENTAPSHVTLELMTWTRLDSPNDQDPYRLSRNMSVTTNNLKPLDIDNMQWTINFSLPVGNQLCFEANEELGLSFTGNTLQVILVNASGQSVLEAVPSLSNTCSNLNDLYTTTTASSDRVPLMAVRISKYRCCAYDHNATSSSSQPLFSTSVPTSIPTSVPTYIPTSVPASIPTRSTVPDEPSGAAMVTLFFYIYDSSTLYIGLRLEVIAPVTIVTVSVPVLLLSTLTLSLYYGKKKLKKDGI